MITEQVQPLTRMRGVFLMRTVIIRVISTYPTMIKTLPLRSPMILMMIFMKPEVIWKYGLMIICPLIQAPMKIPVFAKLILLRQLMYLRMMVIIPRGFTVYLPRQQVPMRQ